MRPTEKQIKRLHKWIDKWRPRLFLGEWFFDLHYSNDIESDSAAQVNADPVYLRAVIIIHPGFWRHSLKDQEHMLVHEMCHCISEEAHRLVMDLLNDRNVTMRNAGDVRERLTQRIANLAFREEW